MNRKPWIVKFDNNIGSAYRTGGRLAVGSQFSWWDCRGVMAFRRNVTVTSFSDDSETLIACAPQTEPIENRMAAKEVMKELLQKEEPVTNTVNNPAKKYRFTRADLCPRKERHGKIPS